MIHQKISLLQNLAKTLSSRSNEELLAVKKSAERNNRWFTQNFIDFALQSIVDNYLDENKLKKWLSKYELSDFDSQKNTGLILAGNIPLVGFHDILSCFVLNLPTQIKLSSKDRVLCQYVVKKLKELDSNWKCDIVDRMANFDQVIATGSNNTNRYFEYYFKNVPALLRNNRSSIAILNGQETDVELKALADDIFMFFGQGCRNVSRLFLPQDYDITILFPHFEKYNFLHHEKLYMDNYDYTRTLLLMNQTPHFANEFLMLKEDNKIASRLATVNYSFYKKETEIIDFLNQEQQNIQCIVSRENKLWNSHQFGKAQQPELFDYADNVDVIDFLIGKKAID